MEALFFNVRPFFWHLIPELTKRPPQIDTGFLEGIVRGYKSGILSQNQYGSLAQCESLEGEVQRLGGCAHAYNWSTDFRTQLSATDYGGFLANEPLPLSTSTIQDKATQILVDQFNYLRSNSVQPLTKFLEYITWVALIASFEDLEPNRSPVIPT